MSQWLVSQSPGRRSDTIGSFFHPPVLIHPLPRGGTDRIGPKLVILPQAKLLAVIPHLVLEWACRRYILKRP
jgi:hypothetical protein